MTTNLAVRETFEDPDDVLAGLRLRPKRLPCRLLYDAAGAELFERITALDDYYPTRTELRLLDDQLPVIAWEIGPSARIIEPGSGAGIKTRRLLRALERPAGYVAIDVARDQLDHTAAALRAEHAELEVDTIAADFTRELVVPPSRRSIGRTVAFFPGSTIGNFEPFDAVAFLARLQRLVGPDGRLLLGADHTRDRARLVRAYDDADGVTAEFDRNVLVHLNRTRGATFDPVAFAHRAVWNELRSRVEMHLVSRRRQHVQVGDVAVELDAGEPIVTEYAYKHTPHAMRGILLSAGWQVRNVYARDEVRLWLCEPASRS